MRIFVKVKPKARKEKVKKIKHYNYFWENIPIKNNYSQHMKSSFKERVYEFTRKILSLDLALIAQYSFILWQHCTQRKQLSNRMFWIKKVSFLWIFLRNGADLAK